jgi:1,4-dihydroxy-2-naphthoate octaprenyltransferase
VRLGDRGNVGNFVSVTRANFLPLTIVIVFAGLSAAFYAHRVFNAIDSLLVLAGALLTHAAVNTFNNYFDYRSRIDERTTKTPFSGGVDILVKGTMKPNVALAIGLVCFLGAALIGVFFLLRMFYPLLPFVSYGAIVIIFYTPILSKVHALSEVVAGTGFGLMGLGTYVSQTGVIDGSGITVFVPVTILVALLLFLNEFPDAEVDRAAGRRHLVILLGRMRAAKTYLAGLVATYGSILLAVLLGAAPPLVLVSFASTPIAFRAGRIALENYDQTSGLIPALGLNVIVILSTILLLAVGFSIAGVAR